MVAQQLIATNDIINLQRKSTHVKSGKKRKNNLLLTVSKPIRFKLSPTISNEISLNLPAALIICCPSMYMPVQSGLY